ncbi:hypothetical protein CEXT_191591 [Caerostris extrusa]|uniref:Uncharacterized protein n=1 Tax=Caerostris extrusa TaxID=172846 RepID=A0AAV4R7D7_CAEEX|nr:hypothetical protein CEXT_191591 [Caerostris extrusa]
MARSGHDSSSLILSIQLSSVDKAYRSHVKVFSFLPYFESVVVALISVEQTIPLMSSWEKDGSFETSISPPCRPTLSYEG